MHTASNLHYVSRVYFFAFAFAFAFLGLGYQSGLLSGTVLFWLRLFDVPFAMVGLMYGGSGLYLQLNEGEETVTPWAMAVAAICIALFAFVVFMNFAFPSRL